MKHKEPTATSVVEEAMRSADDFITAQELVRVTKLDYSHVSAALCHFRKYSAAECLTEGAKLWWYLTPGTDKRSHKHLERTPEPRPRKPRRKLVKL